MAIISVKTNLIVSVQATDTPKTTLIQLTDNGSGSQESHVTTGFGSELISNGDFPTATTGWTAVNSVLSIDTARLKITNSGANQGYAHQAITTTVGKTYRLQFDVTLGNASKANVFVGNSINSDAIGRRVVTEDGTMVFVATATTTYIHLQNFDAVNADYNFYDNISVKLSNGSLYMGRATDGTKANERLMKRSLNTRIL